MPTVLDDLFELPKEMERYPRIVILDNSLQEDIFFEKGNFLHIPRYSFLYNDKDTIQLHQRNTIFLNVNNNGILERMTDSLNINGHYLHLKPIASSKIENYKKKNMYHFMFEELD
ncbi:MAG: hypothetical protein HC905_30890 [Bacteroidales bacterium]|nr:hypothetical protein [Bacteroidales bacterium]